MIETAGEEVDSFTFYLKFAKPLVINLPDPAERALAAAWVKKLKDETTGTENVRKEYLKLLLFVLHRRHLIGPFLEDPSKQNLVDLTQELNILDYAKQMILKEAADRKARIQRGLGAAGDYPPYSVECSSDLLEYAAAQDIPKFGVHAYYAISFEPLTKWDNADKAIYPKGAVQEEMEKSLGQAASAPAIGERPEDIAVSPKRPGTPAHVATPEPPQPSVTPLSPVSVVSPPPPSLTPGSPKLSPRMKTPTPSPKTPQGAAARSPRVSTSSKKSSMKKKITPEVPKSPFGSLEPPDDDRQAITWASNFIDVEDPEDVEEPEALFSTAMDLSLDMSAISGLEQLDSSISFGGDTTADEASDVSIAPQDFPPTSESTSADDTSMYYDTSPPRKQDIDYRDQSVPYRTPTPRTPRMAEGEAAAYYGSPPSRGKYVDYMDQSVPYQTPTSMYYDTSPPRKQDIDYRDQSVPYRTPTPRTPRMTEAEAAAEEQMAMLYTPRERAARAKSPADADYRDQSIPYKTPSPRAPRMTEGEAAAEDQMAMLFSPGERAARAKSPAGAAADVHIPKSPNPEAQEIIDEAMQSMHGTAEPEDFDWDEPIGHADMLPGRRTGMPETPSPLKKYVTASKTPGAGTRYEPEQFGLTGEEEWAPASGFDFGTLPDAEHPQHPHRTQWKPPPMKKLTTEEVFKGMKLDEYSQGFFEMEAPHLLSDDELQPASEIPDEDVNTRLRRLLTDITADAKESTPAASGVATTIPGYSPSPTRIHTDFPIFEEQAPEYVSPKLSPTGEAQEIQQRADAQYSALMGTPARPKTPPRTTTPPPPRDPNADEYGMPLIRVPTPAKVPPPKAPPRAATPKAATPRAATPRAESPRAASPRAATPRDATPGAAAPRATTPRQRTPQPSALTDTPRRIVADSDEAETADEETSIRTEPKSATQGKSAAEIREIKNQQMADLYDILIATADYPEPKTPTLQMPVRSGGRDAGRPAGRPHRATKRKLDFTQPEFTPEIVGIVDRVERDLGDQYQVVNQPPADLMQDEPTETPFYPSSTHVLDTQLPVRLPSPLRPPSPPSPTSAPGQTEEQPFLLHYHGAGQMGITEEVRPREVHLEIDSRQQESPPSGPEKWSWEEIGDPFRRPDEGEFLEDDVAQLLATHEPVPYKDRLRLKVGKKTMAVGRGTLRPPPVDFIDEEPEFGYVSPPREGWAKELPVFDKEVVYSPPSTLNQPRPQKSSPLLTQAGQYFVHEFPEAGQQDMLRRVINLVGDVEQEPLFEDLQDEAAALPQSSVQIFADSPPVDYREWEQYDSLLTPERQPTPPRPQTPPAPRPPTPQAAPAPPAQGTKPKGIPKPRLSKLPTKGGPPSKTGIKVPGPAPPGKGVPPKGGKGGKGAPSRGSSSSSRIGKGLIAKGPPSKGALPTRTKGTKGPPPTTVLLPPPKLPTPPPRQPTPPPRVPTPKPRVPTPPPPANAFEDLPEFTFQAPVEYYLPTYKPYHLPIRPTEEMSPVQLPSLPPIATYEFPHPGEFEPAELLEPTEDVWESDLPEIEEFTSFIEIIGPEDAEQFRQYHPNEVYGPEQADDYMNLSFPYQTPPPPALPTLPHPRPPVADQAEAAQIAMLFPDRAPPQLHPNQVYGPQQAQDYMNLSLPYQTPPPMMEYYSPLQHFEPRQRGMDVAARPSRSRLRRRKITKRRLDFTEPDFDPELETLVQKMETKTEDVQEEVVLPENLMQFEGEPSAEGIYYPPTYSHLDTDVPDYGHAPMQPPVTLPGWTSPEKSPPERDNQYMLHYQALPMYDVPGLAEEALPDVELPSPVSILPDDYEPLATEMPFMSVKTTKTTRSPAGMQRETTSRTELRSPTPPRPVGSPHRAPPRSYEGSRSQPPYRGTPLQRIAPAAATARSLPQRLRRPPVQAAPEIADLRHLSPTRPSPRPTPAAAQMAMPPSRSAVSRTQSPFRTTPLPRAVPGATAARSLSPGQRYMSPAGGLRAPSPTRTSPIRSPAAAQPSPQRSAGAVPAASQRMSPRRSPVAGQRSPITAEATAAAQMASLYTTSPLKRGVPTQSGMSLTTEETTTTSADGTTTKTTKVTQITPHKQASPRQARTPEPFEATAGIDLGAEAAPALLGYMSPPSPGSPVSPLSREDTMREMIRQTRQAPGKVVRRRARPQLREALPSMVELPEARNEPHDTYTYWPGRYDPGFGEVVPPSPTAVDVDLDDYILPSERLAAPAQTAPRPRVDRQQIYQRVEEMVQNVDFPEDQQIEVPVSPPVQYIYESPRATSPRTPGAPAFDILTEDAPHYESPVMPPSPYIPSPFVQPMPPGYPRTSPISYTPSGPRPPPPLRTPPIFTAEVGPQDFLGQQEFEYEPPRTPEAKTPPRRGEPGYYSPREDAEMAAFMFDLEAHEYTDQMHDRAGELRRSWVRSGRREFPLGAEEPDLERIAEIEEPEDTGYRRTPIYVREEQMIEIDEDEYGDADFIEEPPIGVPIGVEYEYEATQQGPLGGRPEFQQIVEQYERVPYYGAPYENIMDAARPIHEMVDLPPALIDQGYGISEEEPVERVDYDAAGMFDPEAYQRQLDYQNQAQPLPALFQEQGGEMIEEDYALPEEAGFEVEAPQRMTWEPDIMEQLRIVRGDLQRLQSQETRTETVVTQDLPATQGRPPQHIESHEVIVQRHEPPAEQDLKKEVGTWEDYYEPTESTYVQYEPNWASMPSPPRPPPRNITFSEFPEAPQRTRPYKPPRPLTPAKPKKKVKRVIPQLSPTIAPRVPTPPPRMPSPRLQTPPRQVSPRQPLLPRVEGLISDVPIPEMEPGSPPMQLQYFDSPVRRPPPSPRPRPVARSPRQESPGVAGYVSPSRRVVTEVVSEIYYPEYMDAVTMEGDYAPVLDTSDIPEDDEYYQETTEDFTWIQ